MTKNNDLVLEILLGKKIVTKEQIEKGRQYIESTTDAPDIIGALKKLHFTDDETILEALASEFGMEVIDLSSTQISKDIVDSVSGDLVKEFHVIPIAFENNTITIAMGDPTDIDTLDSLRFLLKWNVEAVIAPIDQIDAMIEHFYGSIDENVNSFLKTMDEDEEIETASDEDGSDEDDDSNDNAPIIKLVHLIILEAFKRRASDIHLEPLEKKFRVRYRIDGVLIEVDSPPKYLQTNIISRLKIMANLDIAEKRVPQDGRIQIKVMNKSIDLRVSSVPSSHGESLVMRILDKSSIMIDISSLGFFSDDIEIVRKIINMPDGIFLVTGPTGSGKTTSLYAFLNTVNEPTKKIITAEDPVEYNLDGINQVQIRSEIGMTFGKALRAMMRQSPNIIMVGEIRDEETAGIAVNAALTGHLVFSTLHTNDAPSAISRLVDIGIKPFLVASAVRAVMAQRLVRKTCTHCAEPYEPSEEELEFLGITKSDVKKSDILKGAGCAECSKTGYHGRIGIIEIFMVSDEIQEMIFKGESSFKIKEEARKLGMRTLREDGIRKVLAGITTVDEVLRVSVADSES
ncbi:MAG: type II secretion system ATPase GspE [bacterium]|nr:type II secretion system ATPase GspE [bacterium]